MTKKIVLGVIALLLTVGISAGTVSWLGLDEGAVKKIVESAITQLSESFGASTTHDLGYWYKVGGVLHYGQSMTMKTSTTTPCALQGPAASSTLIFFSAYFKTSSTSASLVTMAKASTAFATTTALGTYNFAANGAGSVVASTTPGQAAEANNFTGEQWAVVGMQGNPSHFSPTGACHAEWIVTE